MPEGQVVPPWPELELPAVKGSLLGPGLELPDRQELLPWPGLTLPDIQGSLLGPGL